MRLRGPPAGTLAGLRTAGWAIADQCAVSAANFLTVFLLARGMRLADFGAFMLAYSALLLLTGLQAALLTQPHNVLAARFRLPRYRRFTAALAMVQAAFCATGCALIAAAGGALQAWHPAAGDVLLALAAATAPWLAQEFARRLLYTRREVRAAALNDFLTYGLQLAGAAWLVLSQGERTSPQAALAVLGGSSLAGFALGAWQVRRHLRVGRASAAFIGRQWARAWLFGRWLLAQNGASWFGTQSNTWIVGALLGAEQVGVYRAVTHLVNAMNPVLQACFSHLPSRGSIAFQAEGVPGLAQWVNRLWWVLVAALAPFCVVLIGFPAQALQFAYGARFAGEPLALLLALTALAQCVLFAKIPFDLGLLAMEATRSIFLVTLLPVALLFSAGVALIAAYGILGVPLSSLLVNATLLAATGFAYRRRLGGGAAPSPTPA